MAPTLASSIQKNLMYDVFLSFTGQDMTSKTFVDNLYVALQQQGITVFKYDERREFKEKVVETIETRRNVMDYLIRSINDSKFHVIIFSKNYASSSWCLNELVKIMECHKYTAYPIFYDMEPTEVRNQSVPPVVGEAAFATHDDVEEELVAKTWRDALEEAGDLPGWELKNMTVELDGLERKIIQKIVQDISLQLSLNDWTVDEEKRCLFNQHEFERSAGSIEAGVM